MRETGNRGVMITKTKRQESFSKKEDLKNYITQTSQTVRKVTHKRRMALSSQGAMKSNLQTDNYEEKITA